ncbi:MAG: EF-P lysine aminoacylase EpmA [Pseudomonadota bacterium]
MNWWLPHNFEKKKPYLELRARAVKAIRAFFDDQDFWEVETPALQIMPCADMHIHGFETKYFGPDLKQRQTFYLHTSPEFEMKKLLVAGCPKIYQLCHVFRNGEDTKLHSPEFTMLEWYQTGCDYNDIAFACEGLVRAVCAAVDVQTLQVRGKSCDPFEDWEYLTVAQAFDRYANIDLESVLEDKDAFAKAAQSQGIRTAGSDNWDDIFHAVMAEKIEPHLGQGAPTILIDYPVSMACLSKKKGDNPNFAERFELYLCGVEIANAFSELTHAAEQRKRFEEEMAAKEQHYGFRYPIDEDFLSALEHGMPEAGGIALGVDRLIMLLCGAENIADVLWTGRP